MTKSNTHEPGTVVGVLGGGQLGRMMAPPAARLGLKLIVADPTPNSPAGQVCEQIEGSFKEKNTVLKLAKVCDIMTTEIEHVNVVAMQQVEQECKGSVIVQPTPMCISLIQDKYLQKQHLTSRGLKVVDYLETPDYASVVKAGEQFGYPMMLKCKRLAYDGKGNMVVKTKQDIPACIERLTGQCGGTSDTLYVEKWYPYVKELAVMVVSGLNGEIKSYPVVETIQTDNICHMVFAPASVSKNIGAIARDLSERAVKTFESAGIFGVELFINAEGDVVVNEIAPRPHNSGHYTIEACHTCQFENHLRAITGQPIGNCELRVGASVMLNVIGVDEKMENAWEPFARALSCPGASPHWYGKSASRKGRKMGHITFCGNSHDEILSTAKQYGFDLSNPEALMNKGVAKHDSKSVSAMVDPLIGCSTRAQVGVIMGSDSDLPKMKACATILHDFGIDFELTIVSAHRTPDRMFTYAKNAHQRGLKVIIAAAGGAAHLPGMVAAITPLPVIGVPIPLKYLDGMDSLYSICQMPRGVPVATVAIGNSTNAALLAIRMLGSHDSALLEKMVQYQEKMKNQVEDKISNLDHIGWKGYGENNL